jgi:serine/threonine protein kinase
MTDTGSIVVSGGYAPGDLIADKYRLEEKLGEGGQATVFRARNLSLDAPVAIKLVHEAEDRAPANRLLREARAAARIGHPAIVRVFDLGETDRGDPFLVMELLSGEDLASLLARRGALTTTEAARILLPIADALVAAHAQSIVHRDLKPANVFLSRNGDSMQPKLLDFGIVKWRPAPSSKRPEVITNDGVVIGSLAYLSPEQARGLPDVDERADVWCFCTMLYECVTGEMPFQGTTYDKLLRSIVDDEPRRLSEFFADDPRLQALLDKGMAKSADERWASMRELGHELAAWLFERGVREDACGISLESKWLRDDPREKNVIESGETVMSAQHPPTVLRKTPRTPREGTTAASFSSSGGKSMQAATRRNWMLVGGLGLGVGLLGLVVDRLLASDSRLPVASQSASLPAHAPRPSLRAAPSGIPVAPIPAGVSVSAPEVVPLPSGAASLEPPATPASNITGVPRPNPNAKPRIAPVARPALSAVKEPASGKPSSPPSPAATGAETDLLDPY